MKPRNEEPRDKTRRIQSPSQPDADTEQHKETGSVSGEVEHQSERTSGAVRKKSRKRPSSSPDTITGGIIRRLIQSAQNRKAEAEAEIQDLEGLLEELQRRLDENP
jgi:hypothetical protein